MNEETREIIFTKIRVKKELERRTAKKSLSNFTEYVNDGNWVRAKHLVFIQEKVESLIDGSLKADDGREADILLISMPPQHGKSMSLTEVVPAYEALRKANNRIMIVGYGTDLSRGFNRQNRSKIEEFGTPLFDVQLVRKNDNQITLSNGSSIKAVGMLSGITGNPGDLIIIDDPLKNRQEADSELTRGNVWKEFQNSIRSRLSAKAKIIVIMTRWHEDDLYGRIDGFKGIPSVSINLPIEAQEDDPLGRSKGEALFPEIGKDTKWLKSFKKSYITDPYEGGKRSWHALYMGEPSEREGNIFKRKDWGRYINRPNFVKTLPILVLSVDASFKGETGSDKVSIQVWGKKGTNVYFVDNVTDIMGFTETKRQIKKMLVKYPSIGARYIEDKANGSAIIETLNIELGGFIPVKADVSTGGKVARAYAIQPFVEAGNVYLPDQAPWVEDFIKETSSFPNGRYKDQVDAFTQVVNKLMHYYANNIGAKRAGFEDFFSNTDEREEATAFGYSFDDSFIDYGN